MLPVNSKSPFREPFPAPVRTCRNSRIRSGYSLTTADTLVPPETQRAMAASIGAPISEIHTDHGPFREQPDRLAELVVGAVADRN